MAVVDVDDDGIVLPFAASILARDLVTAGMPTADALPLARRVGDELASHGQPVVSSAVLGSETARQLAACGGCTRGHKTWTRGGCGCAGGCAPNGSPW